MNKKIAMVLDTWDYPYNGMVVSNKRFIKRLEAEGFEFVIFALGEGENATEQRVSFENLPIPGANHILHKMRSPFAMPDQKKLEEALKGCDLLSVQYPFFLGTSAVTVARRLGIPVVCSFHVQPENMLRNLYIKSNFLVSLIYKVFNKALYNRADMVVAPSPFAESLLKKYGVHKPITVISNGVPDNFLRVDTKPCKQEGPYTILSVGRFAKEKNQRLILEALDQSRFKDQIRVVFVGAGPQEANLHKIAAKMPFDVEIGNVSHERLLSLYDTADLFIHASEVELEGMSVLEAMAGGMPVVVSDSEHSAAKDIVVDDRSLFSFPSVESLTSKIDYWLENTAEREQAHLDNAKRALSYSHKASSEKFSRVYRELILGQEETAACEAEPALAERNINIAE